MSAFEFWHLVHVNLYICLNLSITENDFAVLHSMTFVDFQFKLL